MLFWVRWPHFLLLQRSSLLYASLRSRAQHSAQQPQQNETLCLWKCMYWYQKILVGSVRPCPTLPHARKWVWLARLSLCTSLYARRWGQHCDWQFPQNLMESGRKFPKESGSVPEIYYVVHFQCTFFSRATSFFAVLNGPKLLTLCITVFEWGSRCIGKVMRALEEGFSTSELLVCWAE